MIYLSNNCVIYEEKHGGFQRFRQRNFILKSNVHKPRWNIRQIRFKTEQSWCTDGLKRAACTVWSWTVTCPGPTAHPRGTSICTWFTRGGGQAGGRGGVQGFCWSKLCNAEIIAILAQKEQRTDGVEHVENTRGYAAFAGSCCQVSRIMHF